MQSTSDIQIHPEGKIDIHKRQEAYEAALVSLESDCQFNDENRVLILRFIRDCRLGKTIVGRSRKRVGVARCLKYIGLLKKLSGWFGKSFHDVTQEDMECLIEKLDSDAYRTSSGTTFAEATKTDVKKTIKKFWKWKDGNNRTYPELVEWIESYEPVKDVPALRREEVEKMVELVPSIRDKALIMVLFDSGARIEELLNVRLKPEHLDWSDDLGCYRIRLEFSKTKPRTISLPLSSAIMRTWLTMHPMRKEPHAQLFPITYASARMQLSRIGRRLLGKRVCPHLLRHSSVTFYANKLSRYQLCYRYGWTMSSRVVDRYLDRAGILEESTAEAVRSDEIHLAEKASSTLREELTLTKEAYAELAESHRKVEEELAAFRTNSGVLEMIQQLGQQQARMAVVLRELSGQKFDVVLPQSSMAAESDKR